MFDFLTLKQEAFGLDISNLSLKIIKLKKRRKFFDLASFGEADIKPGIIKQGEIKKEKDLVKIIRDAYSEIKGEKLKTKYVVASLPEEKAFLQVIQMPIMSKQDLQSAVVYEAENYIPLPIEKVYLSFQVIPPARNHLDHLDVLIAALPKQTVDTYVSCFKKAGLKPIALEVESLAVSRALIKNETTASPVLLIDLGANRTGFIVFAGHSLKFTSSIPVSSQSFTNIISKTLRVDIVKAEKLKLKYGLKEKKVFDALIPALIDLVEQIQRYLDYYQTHTSNEHLSRKMRDKRPVSPEKMNYPAQRGGVSLQASSFGGEIKKIFLCGGGAKLKGFTDFLSDQLKITVDVGNPWINILPHDFSLPKKSLIYEKEESLRYTTALGLAIRGIKRNF